MHRITVSIPCFGRPARTRRLLQCLENQTINNFECFIIGDGCPHFQELYDSEEYKNWMLRMEAKGNKIISFNNYKNYGGYGYNITNFNIKHATGKYFIFVDNDDFILENHLEFYLSQIENTDYDMVYYNSILASIDSFRMTELKQGYIGHSEIIVKTEMAKKLPPHEPTNFHDWSFIKAAIDMNFKIKKSADESATYQIMNLFWIDKIENADIID